MRLLKYYFHLPKAAQHQDDDDHDDGWLACLGCRQRNAIFEYADLRVHGRGSGRVIVTGRQHFRVEVSPRWRFAFGRRAFACNAKRGAFNFCATNEG